VPKFTDERRLIMESESSDTQKGQSGIIRAALFGSCPQCGASTLFEAPARVALTCSHCGLDLGALERGGRLVGVVTALTAIILILAAYGIESAFRPPLWLQAAFWAPVTVFGVIGALRLFKVRLLYEAFEEQAGKPSACEEKGADE